MNRDPGQPDQLIGIERRAIELRGAIGDAQANDCIARLLYFNSCDKRAPVTITINSPGGSVAAGLAMRDTIKKVTCPVHTFCEGFAGGTAVLLLAAGCRGRRGAVPNAYLMLIRPSDSGPGASIGEKELHQYKRLVDRLADLLAEDTRIPRKQLLSLPAGGSITLSTADALKSGILDYIDREPQLRPGRWWLFRRWIRMAFAAVGHGAK